MAKRNDLFTTHFVIKTLLCLNPIFVECRGD